jgi:hypothetical protein
MFTDVTHIITNYTFPIHIYWTYAVISRNTPLMHDKGHLQFNSLYAGQHLAIQIQNTWNHCYAHLDVQNTSEHKEDIEWKVVV